jgi:C1A family cysteine protease
MSFGKVILASLAAMSMILLVSMLNDGRLSKRQHLDSFMAFIAKNNKSYNSLEELEYRFSVYIENLRHIERINSQNLSFTLTDNKFADLTFAEFSNKYLSKVTSEDRRKPTPQSKSILSDGNKDWRTENKVTPVKNQSVCGACWAFTAAASLESALAIKNNELVNLSVMELVDCSYDYKNKGCNGGLAEQAFEYIIDNNIGLESDYPYHPFPVTCQANKEKKNYGMTDYKVIDPVSVDGMTKAIDTNPVAFGFEVRDDFHLVNTGIYHNSDQSCGYKSNHAMTAVGYSVTDGSGYFIVKNSWGEDWADKGYVRIAIDNGLGVCGIVSSESVYPII